MQQSRKKSRDAMSTAVVMDEANATDAGVIAGLSTKVLNDDDKTILQCIEDRQLSRRKPSGRKKSKEEVKTDDTKNEAAPREETSDEIVMKDGVISVKTPSESSMMSATAGKKTPSHVGKAIWTARDVRKLLFGIRMHGLDFSHIAFLHFKDGKTPHDLNVHGHFLRLTRLFS
jgi:hypothetical protein